MSANARRSGLFLLCAVAWTLVAPATSRATITTYTNRATWLTALGSPLSSSENFEGFASDVLFRTVPANFSGFTLAQLGAGTFRNLVEVSPFEFTDNNGTKHASMFVDFGVTQVELVAASPMRAFGADFTGTGGGELADVTTVSSGAKVPLRDVSEVTGVTEFWGYIATGADVSSRLRFSARTNLAAGEGFGMDNVGLAIVPEPSTLAIGVATALALVGRARRRRCSRAVA